MKRLFSFVFKKLPIRRSVADDYLHLLNNREVRAVQKLETTAVIIAAILGMNGVLLLYLPQYWFPTWFPVTNIGLFGVSIAVSIPAVIFGVILSFAEVYLLFLLNLYCAHEIAVATGFLTKQTKADTLRANMLLDISLEKKNKEILRFGIDPYQGLSKQTILLFSVLFSLKATLSNVAVRLVLSRLLGRYAVREVLDLAGIPIFAFWNAIAVKIVLREARVVIMGQNLIELLLNRIPPTLSLSTSEQHLLYDTLQFIAICKRDYHRNHYYLTNRLLQRFEIQPKQKHLLSKDYMEQLKTASPTVANLCKILILTGLLLDGELSTRERKRLETLHQQQVLDETYAQMKKLTRDFYNGKGIEALMEKYLA